MQPAGILTQPGPDRESGPMARVTEESLDRVLVKTNDHYVFLRPEEIDWVEAQGNYVRLHVRKKQYLVRRTIKEFESKLDTNFVRIHRSTIVNLDRIAELRPLSHGDLSVVLSDGTKLRWSRSYKGKLRNF